MATILNCSKSIRFYQYPSTSASTANDQQAYGHSLDATVYPSRWNEWIQYLEFTGFGLPSGHEVTSAILTLSYNSSSSFGGRSSQQLFNCYNSSSLLTTSSSITTVRNSCNGAPVSGGSGWTTASTYQLDITSLVKGWSSSTNGLILRTKETSSSNWDVKLKPLNTSNITLSVTTAAQTLNKPSVTVSKKSGLVTDEQVTFTLSSNQSITTFAYSVDGGTHKTNCGSSITFAPNSTSVSFYARSGSVYSSATTVTLSYKPTIGVSEAYTTYTARTDASTTNPITLVSTWTHLIKPTLTCQVLGTSNTTGTVSVYLNYNTSRGNSYTKKLVLSTSFSNVNKQNLNILSFVNSNKISLTNGVNYYLSYKYTLNGEESSEVSGASKQLAKPPLGIGIINRECPNTTSMAPTNEFPSKVGVVYSYDSTINDLSNFTISSMIGSSNSTKWGAAQNFYTSSTNKILGATFTYTGTEYQTHNITSKLNYYGTSVTITHNNFKQFTPIAVAFKNTKFGLLTTDNTAITNRYRIYARHTNSIKFGFGSVLTNVSSYSFTFNCNGVTENLTSSYFSEASGFDGRIFTLNDNEYFYDFAVSSGTAGNNFNISYEKRKGQYTYTVTLKLTSVFGDTASFIHQFPLDFADTPVVSAISAKIKSGNNWVTFNPSTMYMMEGQSMQITTSILCHSADQRKVKLQVARQNKNSSSYGTIVDFPSATTQIINPNSPSYTAMSGHTYDLTYEVPIGELPFSLGSGRRIAVDIDGTEYNTSTPTIWQGIVASAPIFSISSVTVENTLTKTNATVISSWTEQYAIQSSVTHSTSMTMVCDGNTKTKSSPTQSGTVFDFDLFSWEQKNSTITFITQISQVISGTANTLEKKTSINWKLFSDLPTVAYRKNQLGINTDRLLTSDAVVIQMPDTSKRRVRLIGPNGETFIYNLNHQKSSSPLPISQGGIGANTGLAGLAQLFAETPSFTKLTGQNEATSITGGYIQLGKLVIVQCQITVTAISQSVRTVAGTLPAPMNSYAGLGVGHSSTGSNINAFVNDSRVLRFSGPCDAGTYYINGVYFCV